ncbi:MAG: hypothetical protein LQ337_003472 [Flavoplaca oasis]|nr:MAG: hypothetical protein LQ337_003472 [Flavoplaca oasis]
MELWGAMKADFQRPLRKVGLFALVVGGIVVAVASGPSSAILLIPRIQLWPAGNTHIWINATADQIWPACIDGTNIPEACSSVGVEASNVCPASEWNAIRDFLAVRTQLLPRSYQDRFRHIQNPGTILLHGKSSTRNMYLAQIFVSKGPKPQCATTQQAVIADALVAAAGLWQLSLVNVTAGAGHGSPLSDQSESAHRVASNYSQPYSTAVCIADQIQNQFDSRQLGFPILPFTNPPSSATRERIVYTNWGKSSTKIIEHPYYSFHQLLETPGDPLDYRLRWIELPRDMFSGSSIGVAVLLPPRLDDSEYNVLLCNLAAGWSLSSLIARVSPVGIGTTESTAKEAENKGETFPISEVRTPEAYQKIDTFGGVYQRPDFPQKPINISKNWAQYLDPSVEGFNTSLFNVLSKENAFPRVTDHDKLTAEKILAMLLVNGLARTGWGSTLQGDVKSVGLNREDGGLDGNYWLSGKGAVFQNIDPAQSRDWVSLRLDSSLQGYAYNTLTTPPRIAIAVLMVYCLLVVGHTLYTGITGISSNSWDTIAEVTALAMNSSPTAALRNTCAGITELHIFKLPVRILVSRDEEGEGEHLELVFGSVDKEKISERTIKANRTYGTLPKNPIQEE